MISIRNLSIAVAVAALLSGCTDDLYMTQQAGNRVVHAINAPVENSEKSRTAYDPTEYSSGEIGINWLPSDRIGVFSDNGENNVAFNNQSKSETASTSFVGDLVGNPAYVYFPYTPEAGNDPTAIRGSIPSLQRYSTVTRALESDWKIGAWVLEDKFRFEHLFSFLRFEVNAEGSEVEGEKLESITLTIPGANLCGEFTCDLTNGNVTFGTPAADASTMTMEWSDTPVLTSGTFYGFLTCAPVSGIAGKDIEITINTNRHRATFKIESKVNEILANTYYTLPLNLKYYSDIITWEETGGSNEQAPWVSGLYSKLACSNMVFSLPNTPFMHKIRVKDPSQTVVAYGLPEGLRWNEKRRLVEGTVAAEGDYTYSVEVRNADGSFAFAEGVKLKVSSDLIQPTPMMGWQSWNVLERDISHDKLLAQARKMVDLGLKDAGYVYLGVDDFWSHDFETRDNGTNYPTIDRDKFPHGMKAFTDAVHALGLKVGIYTDAGNVTCGKNNTGSYGYEEVDARAFTEWGFDMLKEDWYTTNQLQNSLPYFDFTATDRQFPWRDTNSAYTLYGRMGDAIAKTGNKLLLYMCEWGIHDPYKWAAETGATCWRVTYDGRDGWNGTGNTGLSNNNAGSGIGLRNAIDLMRHLWPYNGVNHFNDPDMICVGIRGTGGPSSEMVAGTTEGLNNEENETAFVMWCMWSSPILLGMDMTSSDLYQHDMNLLKNRELIAINQDPMGQAAEFIKAVGNNQHGKNVDYYMKDLANGDVAIAVVNLSDQQKRFSIDFSDYDALDPTKTYNVRDLLKKSGAGTLSNGRSITGNLEKHACVVYRLSAQ